MDLFQVWLPDDVIRRIVSIHPPHHLSGPDKIAWVGSASRETSHIGRAEKARYREEERCMVCGSAPKDVVHAIRDCSTVKEVWSQLIPVEKQGLYSWAVQCSSSLKVSHSMRQNVRMSVNGEGSWICLNSDGTLKLDFGLAAAGAVLRDCHGGCFLGFIRNLGHCSVFNAKL
ncbi:hypothetical protein Godav_027850 [Gossypium davidsonii]|uniref:Reverse transcriptase zinc-binding domain-containing protein n=1 Tax=Gossypium davidsonii TaxID=34287 RepID=A0A7J8RXI2_GOSDV|nr:hypothetical protein [Gossypium davidsonii]